MRANGCEGLSEAIAVFAGLDLTGLPDQLGGLCVSELQTRLGGVVPVTPSPGRPRPRLRRPRLHPPGQPRQSSRRPRLRGEIAQERLPGQFGKGLALSERPVVRLRGDCLGYAELHTWRVGGS